MRLKRLSPPTVEPVNLTEAKQFARIDYADDDTLVSALITAAREYVERYTNRALISQQWMLILDWEEHPIFTSELIQISKGNILSIDSITTYDENDFGAVFDPAKYRLSGDRIVLNKDAGWPEPTRDYDGLEVVYTMGYGSNPEDVPAPIRQAILMLIAHWYENREASGDPLLKENKGLQIPFGVTAILQGYKIYTL